MPKKKKGDNKGEKPEGRVIEHHWERFLLESGHSRLKLPQRDREVAYVEDFVDELARRSNLRRMDDPEIGRLINDFLVAVEYYHARVSDDAGNFPDIDGEGRFLQRALHIARDLHANYGGGTLLKEYLDKEAVRDEKGRAVYPDKEAEILTNADNAEHFMRRMATNEEFQSIMLRTDNMYNMLDRLMTCTTEFLKKQPDDDGRLEELGLGISHFKRLWHQGVPQLNDMPLHELFMRHLQDDYRQEQQTEKAPPDGRGR